MVASHSALDVCDGAVEEGFRTVGICQEGREKTYAKYFKCQRDSNGTAARGGVAQKRGAGRGEGLLLDPGQGGPSVPQEDRGPERHRQACDREAAPQGQEAGEGGLSGGPPQGGRGK